MRNLRLHVSQTVKWELVAQDERDFLVIALAPQEHVFRRQATAYDELEEAATVFLGWGHTVVVYGVSISLRADRQRRRMA